MTAALDGLQQEVQLQGVRVAALPERLAAFLAAGR